MSRSIEVAKAEERRRIVSILNLPEAKQAPVLAARLALQSDVAPEAARASLQEAVGASSNHGWDGVVAGLNARQTPSAGSAEPKPMAGHGWDDVAERLES